MSWIFNAERRGKNRGENKATAKENRRQEKEKRREEIKAEAAEVIRRYEPKLHGIFNDFRKARYKVEGKRTSKWGERYSDGKYFEISSHPSGSEFEGDYTVTEVVVDTYTVLRNKIDPVIDIAIIPKKSGAAEVYISQWGGHNSGLYEVNTPDELTQRLSQIQTLLERIIEESFK